MAVTFVQSLQDRARNWAHSRHGDDIKPAKLKNRRIYILPTRQGVGFAIMLVVMLLGSMNYNNNLGLAMTFLLIGVAIISMHQCHANINRLIIKPLTIRPVFAGEIARVRLHVDNPTARARFGVRVSYLESETDAIDVPGTKDGELEFDYPTLRRGEFPLEPVTLHSRYPMTLFTAWSWLFFDVTVLVYPKPDPNAPPLPNAGRTDAGPRRRPVPGDADFVGLRSYRPGDPTRRIAWKALARQEEPMIKEFSDTATETRFLDWDDADGVVEQRLSTLCAWVLESLREGHQFGMRLPNQSIPLGRGEKHGIRCLTALARF